mgnify:CR=1 FL=1
MKIIGVGIDIVESSRIEKLIKNKKFISRIFSGKEISSSKKYTNKINYFSKRFAAKESFVKSIGTGFRNKINFKDIIVNNDTAGKPYFIINRKIKNIIYKKFNTNNYEFLLSISDEKKYSIAITIFQKL